MDERFAKQTKDIIERKVMLPLGREPWLDQLEEIRELPEPEEPSGDDDDL